MARVAGRFLGSMVQRSLVCSAILLGMLELPLMAFQRSNWQAAANYVLVLDKSASTTGDRHDRMVESANALIASLPTNCQLGVVVFDSHASVLVKMQSLTDARRSEIATAIAAMNPQGGTDMIAGTAKALEMLGAQGGAILLVSDGYQTGISASPLPESNWGPPAREVARRARSNGVIIDTLGLGPDVQADPLLQLLANETGGNFYGVRESSELLAQFVSIASLRGRFWQRKDGAEFTVTVPQTAIQVVASDAPSQLFRESSGRWVPVDPHLNLAHSKIRAERFHLIPGKYSFRPSKNGSSHLLRPLEFGIELKAQELRAGRANEIAIETVATDAPLTLPELGDLHVTGHVRFGDEKNFTSHQAHPSSKGRFETTLVAPSQLVAFEYLIDVEQDGWRYRTNRMRGQLTLPPPIEVTVQPSQGTIKKLITREPDRKASAEFAVQVSTTGQATELLLSSSDSRVQVEPARISLEKPSQSVKVSMLRNDIDSAELTSKLQFEVATKDMVPAKINGGNRYEVDIELLHLRPQLQLSGLQRERTIQLPRGTDFLVPIELQGKERTDQVRLGVELGECRLPPGISLGLTKQVGTEQPESVAVLLPETIKAGLRFHVARDTMPNSYPVEFELRSTDPSVPLNGAHENLAYRMQVVVPPIDAKLRIVSGAEPWSVAAPIKDQFKEIELEVETTDDGPLPTDIAFTVASNVPFRELSRQSPSTSTARIRYELRIPAQSPPQQAEFTVGVQANGLRSPSAVSTAIEVREVEISFAVGELRRPRYHGQLEKWLGWMRGPTRSKLQVDFSGRDSEAALPTWRLLKLDGNVESEVQPVRDGSYDFSPNATYCVVVASPYAHARFIDNKPGAETQDSEMTSNTFRRTVRISEVFVSLPWWYYAMFFLLVAASVALCLKAVRQSVISVQLIPGGNCRKLFRMNIGRVLSQPKLKLVLTRTRLTRGRRDTSEDTVFVDSTNGVSELRPGDSIPIQCGDSIEIITSQRVNYVIDILAGRSAKTKFATESADDEFANLDSVESLRS